MWVSIKIMNSRRLLLLTILLSRSSTLLHPVVRYCHWPFHVLSVGSHLVSYQPRGRKRNLARTRSHCLCLGVPGSPVLVAPKVCSEDPRSMRLSYHGQARESHSDIHSRTSCLDRRRHMRLWVWPERLNLRRLEPRRRKMKMREHCLEQDLPVPPRRMSRAQQVGGLRITLL